MDQSLDLKPLFNPSNIAIVGASSNPGSISGQFLRYLKRYGFKGEIYLVNPRHQEISGLRCFSSISTLPQPVDLAICVVPNQGVTQVVEECTVRGVRFLMIPSTGFAEASAEGARLQERITEIARRGHTRLLGPNCMGLINFKDGVVASFGAFLESPKDLGAGNIAFVSQSGLLGARVVRRCLSRGIGLSYEISTGNEADLESLDFIDYLLGDPQTRVIGALIESVKSGPRLLALGRRAQQLGKILVVLKAGKSSVGLEAISSHTGRLSSAAQIYRGVFRQAGIVEARTFNELCLALEVFSLLDKVPDQVRLAVVVGSGGNGVLIADLAEELGVALSELSAETQAAIAALIPEAGSCRNPIDVTAQVTHNQPDKLRQVVELLARERSVTAMIVGVNHRCLSQCWIDLVRIAETSDKIMGVTVSSDVPQEIRQGLKKSGKILLSEDAEELLSMFKPVSDRIGFDPINSKNAPETWEEKHYALAPLTEKEATEFRIKKLLAPYLSVPRGELSHTATEAVAIAGRLGYPVAMKFVAPGLRHKTEIGAVQLNVSGAAEVARVFDRLQSQCAGPSGDVAVLVEEMTGGGVEVIVGFVRSRELGPIVMFGSGGVLVELVRDTVYRSIPLSRAQAEAMIRESLAFKLLKGFRGEAPKDIGALTNGIVEASRIFLANPWIKEMEFNPISVLEQGSGIRVLDALITPGAKAATK